LKLAEDEDALERRQIYLQDAMQLLMEPLRERFAYAEKLTSGRGRKRAESRETLREALQVWLSLWRDVLHQAAGSQLPPANPDVEADIARLSAGLGYQRALRLVKQTDQALTRLSTPLNLRLQTETLLMDWPRIN